MPRRPPLHELYPHVRALNDPHGFYHLMCEHMEWLEVHNYSKATINERTRNLYAFIDWSMHRGLLRPSEVTKPIVERYQRHLYYYRKADGKPLGFQTQVSRLGAIRAWFKWLTKQNYLLYNPAGEISLPRRERRLPVVLSVSEAERILAQPNLETVRGLRDRTMLEVLYSTGIRRAELARLRIDDVDSVRGTLVIRQGKGRKDRVVPIGARALAWVERYRDEARAQLACGQDDGELFLSQYGRALPPEEVTRLARTCVKDSGVNKPGACHLFRHTMATLMIENGADIRYVQAILGHATLETTQIYTHVSIKHLKKVHTLTHPADAKWRKKVIAQAEEIGEEALLSDLTEEREDED